MARGTKAKLEYEDLRLKDNMKSQGKSYEEKLKQGQKRRRQERQMLADITGAVQELQEKETG